MIFSNQDRFPKILRKIGFIILTVVLILSACTPPVGGPLASGAATQDTRSGRPIINLPGATNPQTTPQAATLAPTTDLSALLTPTPFPDIEGLLNFPENVNPLTGLVVEDPSRLDRRPVLVKISNFPRTGRPHAGLTFADMVFEYYIGYGLNRFMGIYYGQDVSQAGPVRSGRLVDAQIGEMYQGMLFYGNADPQVDEVLLGELGWRAMAEKDLPSPPKYRIGKKLDETSLFVNTAELTDYADRWHSDSNTKRDLRGMIFSDLIHPENVPANELGVQFWTTTRGEWKYDPQTGKYLRWIEEVKGDNQIEMIPLVDRLNDQQIAFSNIVILYATYIEYAPTLHDIQLFDNTSGKPAIFFRDGVMVHGTWKTPSNGRPIQFLNPWGLPYHLKQGNTWIVITGDSSLFSETDPGVWELRFDLP